MISKTSFKRYYRQITELVGSSHGIYALYDDADLYYVGKSNQLRTRVRAHLRDRHLASWTHFSLYLVRDAQHIGEIESLLVRIASPKGNRVVPRGKGHPVLARKLRALIRQRQDVELDELFGRRIRAPRKRATPDRGAGKVKQALEGLVERRTGLFREHKGREYRAQLSPKGFINFRGKKYFSPTAAAKAVTGRSSVNGWTFWYAKDPEGEWVTLAEFRK